MLSQIQRDATAVHLAPHHSTIKEGLSMMSASERQISADDMMMDFANRLTMMKTLSRND